MFKALKNMMRSKRGQVNIDSIVGRLVAVVVVTALLSAFVGTVLASITNLTNSGIALGGLFGVLTILFAVFAFTIVFKLLR